MYGPRRKCDLDLPAEEPLDHNDSPMSLFSRTLSDSIKSPSLILGEQLCWRYDITKGLFRKQTTSQYFVTDYRCFILDTQANTVDSSVMMGHFDDVVVMNSQRISSSIGNGFYFGAYGSGRITGTRTGSSSTFGDVCLIKDGKIVLVFNSIQDPHGVKRLIQVLNKAQTKLQKNSTSEEGLNEYCRRIKLRAKENCGLTENELVLKAVKNGTNTSFEFKISSSDPNAGMVAFRCVRNSIEQTIPEMPVFARAMFETLLAKMNQEAERARNNADASKSL